MIEKKCFSLVRAHVNIINNNNPRYQLKAKTCYQQTLQHT